MSVIFPGQKLQRLTNFKKDRREMKIDEIKANAFAMPLTSLACLRGPYRFTRREFLIISYLTECLSAGERSARAQSRLRAAFCCRSDARSG